jgi:hypothetical protein
MENHVRLDTSFRNAHSLVTIDDRRCRSFGNTSGCVWNGGRDPEGKRQSKNCIMGNADLLRPTVARAQLGDGTTTTRVYMITRCADQVSMPFGRQRRLDGASSWRFRAAAAEVLECHVAVRHGVSLRLRHGCCCADFRYY